MNDTQRGRHGGRKVDRIVGLKSWFAELPDPRSSINQRHSLVDVVVISVCGVLAGRSRVVR